MKVSLRVQQMLITSITVLFLLTLFTPQTILLGSLLLFMISKYVKSLYQNYADQGIINFLPQGIRQQLLHRSIFDILCDFWFMEWMTVFKVCFRPFIQHIQPAQAANVLEELPPRIKQKFLKKGIIQEKQPLFNKQCNQKNQKLPILSIQPNTQRYMIKKDIQKQEIIQKPMISKQERAHYISTDETVLNKRMGKMRKGSTILFKRKFIDEPSSNFDITSSKSSKQQDILIKRVELKNKQLPKWDRLELYRGLKKKLAKDGLTATIRSAMQMTKKIVELNQLSNKIQKVKSSKILKISLVFWVLLIMQIKMSPHARKLIFKIIYIIAGVFSILGVIGTTGMLVYKYKQESIQQKNRRKDNDQSDED